MDLIDKIRFICPTPVVTGFLVTGDLRLPRQQLAGCGADVAQDVGGHEPVMV
jgi:hypothetical protein